MSEADKMFEELGYKKIENQFLDVIELWGNDDDKRLSFETDKTICMLDFFVEPGNITMQELKAINKKVEELGWNWDISEFIDKKTQKRIEEGGSIFPID